MALTTTRKITITGTSTIDEKQVQVFTASIDSADPSKITFSNVKTNADLYKANREQCRADAAEFEDYAYEVQDELIAEAAVVSEEPAEE